MQSYASLNAILLRLRIAFRYLYIDHVRVIFVKFRLFQISECLGG
jgi:hypothetical protein